MKTNFVAIIICIDYITKKYWKLIKKVSETNNQCKSKKY